MKQPLIRIGRDLTIATAAAVLGITLTRSTSAMQRQMLQSQARLNLTMAGYQKAMEEYIGQYSQQPHLSADMREASAYVARCHDHLANAYAEAGLTLKRMADEGI